MAAFFSWIQGNWSSVVGAVGIIGSWFYSAAYFRADAQNRLVANLMAIEERHRSFWREAKERSDLIRIFSRDLIAEVPSLTSEEDLFMRKMMVFFETGWRIEGILKRGEMKLLAKDVAKTLSFPFPRAVWEETKKFRNPKLVRFAARACGFCASPNWQD